MTSQDKQTLFPYTTLEEYLEKHGDPLGLALDIDYAMLVLVVSMNYEPSRIKRIIDSYFSLWEIRNLILNQIKN